MKPTLTCLALALAWLLPATAGAPVQAADVLANETCEWRGTAPACDGSCEAGERMAHEGGFGYEFVSAEPGGEIRNEYGEACITGGKVLCCTRKVAETEGVNPDWASFCDGYATRAVDSVAQKDAQNCDLGGARWDPNREAHFNWCLGQEGLPNASAEELHRIRELKECAQQVDMSEEGPLTPMPEPEPEPEEKAFYCAINDVDIYDNPVDPMNVIGMMEEGAKGEHVESHADGFVNLKDITSGGAGWIAGDHLEQC